MPAVTLLDADADGDVAPAGSLQELHHNSGLGLGIADSRHDQPAVQLGRPKHRRNSPSIVDVVTNIGIEDDRLRDCGFEPAGRRKIHDSSHKGQYRKTSKIAR
jgi:hypothetical protein